MTQHPAPASADPASPALQTWQAFAQLGSDLFVLLDARGFVQWVNPAFERVSGWSRAQAAGQALDALLAAHVDEGAWPKVASQLAGGTAIEPVELPWRRADGRLGWCRLSATPIDEAFVNAAPGASRGMAVCMHDCSEPRRLAELLDMTQEFGRLGVWEREIPSGRGQWDPHVFRFFGFDPSEKTPDFDVASQRIHPQDRLHLKYLASTTTCGQYEGHFRVVLPDGRMRRVHSQWFVKPGADGKPARAIGIMLDDTEVYDLARSYNETAEQLRLAVDLGHIAIWRQDLATNRFHYNDRGFQVLGMKPRPDGLSLEEVRALIHPDDLPTVVRTAKIALEATRPIDMSARYRRVDGSWREILMRRVVRRADDGTPIEFLGVALDMTEQFNEARRVRELAERLEVTANAARLGLFNRDIATGETEWNALLYQMLGRPIELGPPDDKEWLTRIVHPLDREAMRHEMRRLNQPANDASFDVQFRVLTPQDEVRWISARARRALLNGRDMVFGVMMDITTHVQTETALRNANARAALAARSAGIGIWEWNPRTRESTWDEAMWRLRGREPRANPPTTEERSAMNHPDDAGRAREMLHRAIDERRTHTYQFRVIWPDGSVRWLASRTVPIYHEHGRLDRYVGVDWDVTDAVDAETQRREKLIAQRDSEAKSQFLARMSHELRTPLNAVLGFAQLLRLEDDVPAAQRHAHVDHILAAGEHLLSLINDVLDLSRLENEHEALALESVPLQQALTQALALVDPLARRLGVRIDSTPAPERVLAQPTRLRQVLLNLLSNAIKYNRPGGTVVLSTRSAAGAVTLHVRGTGRGLSAEQISHLFEPFNRLGIEREGIEGTGIGLAIVKALLERMGGAIEVRSEAGAGSEFRVTLARAAEPRDPAAAPPTPAPAPAHENPDRRARLLYIEDNALNVLLVEELLATCRGLSVRSEPDGARGVARAQAMRPDLVLVDMQLPDFDGLEVLRRLRADARTAAIPCIALSANAMPADIARAVAAGFNDYVTKPIDFAVLMKTIDEVLAARGAEPATTRPGELPP